MEEQTVTRTYYSAAAGLICWATPPQRVFEAGETKVLDGKQVSFTPQADNFGRFVTTDPEIIKYLDWRAKEVGDVFDGNEYTKRTTPPEVRAKQQERVIFEQNRLIADLQGQIAESVREGNAKSPKK